MSGSDELRRATLAAVGLAAVMIGQQVASRAVRDGFFLSHFDASALPAVMTAASLLSVVIVLGSARVFQRLSPATTLPLLFAGSAALFVVEGLLSIGYPKTAASLLYLHTTSVGAVVVSAFWSVVNERFDPHSAKRLIGRIGTGASFGGALGGIAVWLGAASVDITTMILGLAAMNVLCLGLVRPIGGPANPHVRRDDEEVSLIEIVQETPYIVHLALLVVLIAVSGAAYDYVLKSRAADHYTTSADLVAFFGVFYLILGIGTLAVQHFLARRSLLTIGLAATVATLPGAGIVFGLLAFFVPGLGSAVIMRSSTQVVENSLYRSGYELLYTPLIPAKKRATKTLIDVGCDKLGAAAGGGFAFFVLGIFPTGADPILLMFGVATSLAALVVTRWLHRGYVQSLAESLRTGVIGSDEMLEFDGSTRAEVSRTVVDLERAAPAGLPSGASPTGSSLVQQQVAEVLAAHRARARSGEAVVRTPALLGRPLESVPAPSIDPSELDETVAAIVELQSGESQRILDTLVSHQPLPPALVPHVIPLLESGEVAYASALSLRRVAPVHTGVLMDRVLQSRTPLPVRRRICDILGTLPTQRCANGLVLLLEDAEFELRFRAASALLRIAVRNPKLRIPKEPLLEAAEAEAVECSRRWRYQSIVEGALKQGSPDEVPDTRQVTWSLAYIFTLLLAVLDREPLQLAIRSLGDPHGAQRGTGLEYLENVLPPGMKPLLFPVLEDRKLPLSRIRERSHILSEVVAGGLPGVRDLAELRRRVDARRLRSAPRAD